MVHSFVTQFHEIQGNTIGERQRNLNALLKDVPINPEEKQLVLNSLRPKTYLENLFYVDILIHFKETNKLWEIFKEGNGAFVSKIVKQQWFFQEVFSHIDAKTLVDDFLPLLSFSVRNKLFRRLSHVYNEETIDQIFDHVVNKYGLFLAMSFITTCSSEKIRNVLKNNNIKLSTCELKIIYKKEPNLITTYLEGQKQYNNEKIFNNHFLIYLAQNNPVYFWEIMEELKTHDDLKLGRRTTKKLIPARKQEIVANPKKYIKYLRHETLVRKLNKQGDFKQLYYNLFPRDIEILENESALCNTLLKYHPKNGQYNLFTKTFSDIMKEDIWHYTSCVQDRLLPFITNNTTRERWVQLKYKETDDEEYLKYYDAKKSIALIKEKINTTSCIKSRSKLLSLLLKSCAINKDLKALEEVLNYFCVRHRNDDASTRSLFVQTIKNNFNLKELNNTHWKYIHEIFTIQDLNNEHQGLSYGMRLKYIERLFKNNATEEDKNYYILEYLKDQLRVGYLYFHEFEELKSREIQKSVLLQGLEHMDSIMNAHNLEEYSKSYMKSQFIGQILWFNSHHPESKIDIEGSKEMVEVLENTTLNTDSVAYSFYENFAKMLCKLNRSDIENMYLNRYFKEKHLKQYTFEKTVLWYLKHDPLVVANNFDSVLETFPQKKSTILAVIKCLSHLSLNDKLVKHAEHQLKHGKPDKKSEHVQSLSVLSSTEHYIKIMEELNLIPTSSKLVIEDTEARKTYEIKKIFLKNLKNTWNPLRYLPLLLDKFCQGDYLKDSLSPLYYAFHKVPQNELQTYLDKLSNNSAISVKKHGLCLACCIFEPQNVLQIATNLQKINNNSLHKTLCLTLLKYFSRNPNDNFQIALSYMPSLKHYDTESLKLLTSIVVPKKYKALYVTNLWNLLENLEMNGDGIGFGALRSAVLENIDRECISNLPDDFCKTIINNYFGKSAKDDEVSSFFRFLIRFLNNKPEHFTFVFKLLTNYKSKYWHLGELERKTVYTFFDAFYTIACEKETNLDFVIKFSKEWEKVFSSTETFQEYVLLNLLKFQKESEENLELYSKNIVAFAENINTKYGELVYSKFISILFKFCIFANKGRKRIELLTKMIECSTSAVNCILIMELISIKGDLLYKNKVRPMYREINLILSQMTDPKIQLCYNLYSQKMKLI